VNDPRRIGLGVLFLALLAGGLFWVLRAETGEVAPATTSAAPAISTTSTSTSDQPTPTSAIAETVTGPAVTVEPTSAPSVPEPDPPDDVALGDVLPAAQRALAAWGEFAVTGDLSLVVDTFDLNGPQYEQLIEETGSLLADPLGPPPYVFTMRDVELRRPRPQRVVLVGPVSISRAGEPEQTFRWRVHLRWSGSDWLLWTVDELSAG
jgi:hypothetical protein